MEIFLISTLVFLVIIWVSVLCSAYQIESAGESAPVDEAKPGVKTLLK